MPRLLTTLAFLPTMEKKLILLILILINAMIATLRPTAQTGSMTHQYLVTLLQAR